MAKKYSIGVDLGGTKTLVAVFNEKLAVVGSARVPTEGRRGAKEGLKRIWATVQDALKDADVRPGEIRALGIGCPGVVDSTEGVLREASNLGWKKVRIGDYLSRRIDGKVCVLNDVDAGTYAEYHMGAGKGSRSMLGVFPGTGVGGGFVYDGEILRGKAVSCMEIGGLRMLGSTLEGKSNEPVTLEGLCGRLAIASACVVEAMRGNAPTILENAGQDISRIKSGLIKKSIEARERSVLNIMKRSAHYLGIGVTGAVELLAPDVVVLGGGLVEKMPDIYLDGVSSAVSRYGSKAIVRDVRFAVAEMGDLAVASGAAAYALSD
jgi:glucokinase